LIERRIGLTLAESWKAAVEMALTSQVRVITGGPGVGKTTIVNARKSPIMPVGTDRATRELFGKTPC
jgi:exodeoxyribonuclease V alpha subunit